MQRKEDKNMKQRGKKGEKCEYIIRSCLLQHSGTVTSLLWSRLLMTIHFHLTCFALSLDHFRHPIQT